MNISKRKTVRYPPGQWGSRHMRMSWKVRSALSPEACEAGQEVLPSSAGLDVLAPGCGAIRALLPVLPCVSPVIRTYPLGVLSSSFNWVICVRLVSQSRSPSDVFIQMGTPWVPKACWSSLEYCNWALQARSHLVSHHTLLCGSQPGFPSLTAGLSISQASSGSKEKAPSAGGAQSTKSSIPGQSDTPSVVLGAAAKETTELCFANPRRTP